jgi:hypothetical protein
MMKKLVVIAAAATFIIFQTAYFKWVGEQRQMMAEYTLDLMEMQDQDPDKDWTDLGLLLSEKGLTFIGNDSMYLPH